MRIRQYRPGLLTGKDPEQAEFSNKAELLAIPWVARFKNVKDFHQLSVTQDDLGDPDEYTLMVEYENGKEWWVVGYIESAPPAWNELPKWPPEDAEEGGKVNGG